MKWEMISEKIKKQGGKAIPVLLFLLAALPGVFGEGLTLSVEDAVDLALERNLGIRASRISQRRQEITREMSWNNFLPAVTASGTLSYQDKASAVPGYTPAPWDISGSISAQLKLSGELFASMKETVHGYERGMLQLEEAENLLERDVKKAFYSLLLQTEEITLAEKKVSAAERRYITARENYEFGLVPEYSVLSARVSYENSKPELRGKKRDYAGAMAAFKQVIGIEKNDELTLSGEISMRGVELDSEVLIRKYVRDRYDVRNKQAEIEAYRLSRRTLTAGLWPDVTIGASFSGSINGPFGNPWFGDTGAWNSAYPRAYLSLSFPLIDLLPGSSVREEMRKIDSDIAAVEIRLMDVIEKAELTIEGLVADCRERREYISLLELNRELAEEAFRIAEEDYNSGTADLATVEDAQLELEKAQGQVLTETYNYMVSLLHLEFELHTPVEDF